MSYSLFDIGAPGMSPEELVKRAPKADYYTLKFGGESIKISAVVLHVLWGDCKCGARSVVDQTTMYSVKTTWGQSWQAVNETGLKTLLTLHPDVPRKVKEGYSKLEHCLECWGK